MFDHHLNPDGHLIGSEHGHSYHRDHDVFNALDIFENKSVLTELKFGIGDGSLRYYLYNWRSSAKLNPDNVGLVLL